MPTCYLSQVVIDGKLVHSKLKLGSFPQEQEVLQAIEYALEAEKKP